MKQCEHCGKSFIPGRSNQRYCNSRDCQKSRKRQWQKKKMQTDPDYRANQKDAQKRWRKKNKDYSQKYRSSHPAYVERNRQLQTKRNMLRNPFKTPITTGEKIAKMDAKVPDLSGTYYLFSAASCAELPHLIAKMDAKLVKIQSVTENGVKNM